MPIIGDTLVCLSCPYFSEKYGAPPTRPPKCIDEDDNGDCDIDEETETSTTNPVSVHEFIWKLYLPICNPN